MIQQIQFQENFSQDQFEIQVVSIRLLFVDEQIYLFFYKLQLLSLIFLLFGVPPRKKK
jgi:hypothetical protein